MKLADFLAKLKKPRKGLNKPLLLATAERMRNLKHEEHYNQYTFIEKDGCGTAGCLAYHIVLAAGLSPDQAYQLENDFDEVDICSAAISLSGLDEDTGLFGTGLCWPNPYRDRFHKAIRSESDERPSRIAAEMLEAIAKGKVTLNEAN